MESRSLPPVLLTWLFVRYMPAGFNDLHGFELGAFSSALTYRKKNESLHYALCFLLYLLCSPLAYHFWKALSI